MKEDMLFTVLFHIHDILKSDGWFSGTGGEGHALTYGGFWKDESIFGETNTQLLRFIKCSWKKGGF